MKPPMVSPRGSQPSFVKSSPYNWKYLETTSESPSTRTFFGSVRKDRVRSSSRSSSLFPSKAQPGRGAHEFDAQFTAKWIRGSLKVGRSRLCSMASRVRSNPPTRCRVFVQTPSISRMDDTPGLSRIDRMVRAL
jgi:hypothetical protein